MTELYLHTAKKIAPEAVGSFSLSLKSCAARGKSALSRGSTTGSLCFTMRSQMLPPACVGLLATTCSIKSREAHAKWWLGVLSFHVAVSHNV